MEEGEVKGVSSIRFTFAVKLGVSVHNRIDSLSLKALFTPYPL